MKQLEIKFPKAFQEGGRKRTSDRDNHIGHAYLSSLINYVNRINADTLRVTIGGVRIGSAKHSRLAQINLHTRVITFSRFAIENVPGRGLRYLVLHELAHVKEPSHNKKFWNIVGQFEPDYRQVGRELEKAFHQNVREELQQRRQGQTPKQNMALVMPSSNETSVIDMHSLESAGPTPLIWSPSFNHWQELDFDHNNFQCTWEDHDPSESGIISGGFDE